MNKSSPQYEYHVINPARGISGWFRWPPLGIRGMWVCLWTGFVLAILSGCSAAHDDAVATAPDASCPAVDGYKAALARSGCTVPDVVATAPSCADAVADTDACFGDTDCRQGVEGGLLTSCTGLVPQWSYYSSKAKVAP